jgi:6-phospho-3-hexuloisomerase
MAPFDEVHRLSEQLSSDEVAALVQVWEEGDRCWFFTGQGRSGLVAAMVAMRFMHLGRVSHVLGEATAPAVMSGDGLLVISGSGHTPISVSRAARAHELGVLVVAITHARSAPLIEVADLVLTLPTDGSVQLGGSLFEQAALMVLDGVIHALAGRLEDPRTGLRLRHANLE